MQPFEISAAVARGVELRREISARQAELTAIEEKLKKLGKGKYNAGLDACLVVVQSPGKPGYKLAPDAEAKARELAGGEFRSLFDRVVTHKPCEAFNVVAAKILTPAKARDLITLCTVPGKAGCTYVKWD